MPYTQNIVIILFASLFVVGLWYTDKEIKNIQANIKIIQNMLKIVLSNQNSLLKEHNSYNSYNQTHDYIPYSNTVVQPESITPLQTIIEENEEKKIYYESTELSNELIESANESTELSNEQPTELSNEQSTELSNEQPTESINELPELTEPIESANEPIELSNEPIELSNELPELTEPVESANDISEVPRKKRQYRKKAAITV